ncbi:hypothetical protein GWK47_031117 [Chionoecetes opilio]|uniref:Uncharacterized protein n=1 Tax=Chionoecetes opilio TaxID=41210 RepID=A0A8J4YL11_CHIOP|nr:hypothetical protein GWK47_031117 [Chionoecetes opilio]
MNTNLANWAKVSNRPQNTPSFTLTILTLDQGGRPTDLSAPSEHPIFLHKPLGTTVYNDRGRAHSQIDSNRALPPPSPQGLPLGSCSVLIGKPNLEGTLVNGVEGRSHCHSVKCGDSYKSSQATAAHPGPPHPDPVREAERLASSFATRTSTDNLPAETRDKLTELLQQKMIK